MKYFIKNNKINIARYEILYTEVNSAVGTTKTSEVCILVNDENMLENYKRNLDVQGISYRVNKLDNSGYEEFDGVFVSGIEEAESILNPSIDELKKRKIAEISDICERKIYEGIDVTLSSGETKHFSLKQEDQININATALKIYTDESYKEKGVIYHADGEKYTLFSIDDFMTVLNSANSFRERETAYANYLMKYVEALESREDILGVCYGDELTGEFLEGYEACL